MEHELLNIGDLEHQGLDPEQREQPCDEFREVEPEIWEQPCDKVNDRPGTSGLFPMTGVGPREQPKFMSTLRRQMEQYCRDNNYVFLSSGPLSDRPEFTPDEQRKKSIPKGGVFVPRPESDVAHPMERRHRATEDDKCAPENEEEDEFSATQEHHYYGLKYCGAGDAPSSGCDTGDDDEDDDDDIDDDDVIEQHGRLIYLPSDLMEKMAAAAIAHHECPPASGDNAKTNAVVNQTLNLPTPGRDDDDPPLMRTATTPSEAAPPSREGFYVEGDDDDSDDAIGDGDDECRPRASSMDHLGGPDGNLSDEATTLTSRRKKTLSECVNGPLCRHWGTTLKKPASTYRDENLERYFNTLLETGYSGMESANVNVLAGERQASLVDVTGKLEGMAPDASTRSLHAWSEAGGGPEPGQSGDRATDAIAQFYGCPPPSSAPPPAPKFSTISELLKNDIQQLSDDLVETRRQKPPKIVDGHLILDEIGFGAYARVKECLHLSTLQRRAVKIFKMEKIRKIRDALDDIDREVRLLRRLEHKNVIKMYEHFWHKAKGKLYLFVELCASSLQQLLDGAPEKRLGRLTSRFYFAQLLDGLEYLHSQNVAHKDIKAGNLLLTVDHVVKIVDFGVSDELDPYDANHYCSNSRGTPKFQPPEIASGQREFDGFKVDVWCSGVTLFNMLSGLYPYDGSTIFIIYDRIINQKLALPDCIADQDAHHLLQSMLQKDARDRCSIADIRRHPWLRGGTAPAAGDLTRDVDRKSRSPHARAPSRASSKSGSKTSDHPHEEDTSIIDHLIDLTLNRSDHIYEHLENLTEHESLLIVSSMVKGHHANGHHLMPGDHSQMTFDLCPKGNQSDPCMTRRIEGEKMHVELPRTSISVEGMAEPQPEVKVQSLGHQPHGMNHLSLSNLRNFRIRLKKSSKWPKMECKTQ